jgi:hypothetical protein
MRQLLMRGLTHAAPFVFALACESGPDDLALSANGALVESIVGIDGATGRVSSCGASGGCRDLAVGDVIAPGRLIVEGGTSARISVGGMRLALSPESELVFAADLSIEEGDVSIDVDPENDARLRVGDHVLAFAKGRPATVNISRNNERATVVVHRGKLEIEHVPPTADRGVGERLTLSRGQSAELAEERATARYEPSARSSGALHEQNQLPITEQAAVRGLGRMTARRPGTEDVVGGVVLAKHDVSVVIRDGVATTTIEEVFENETNQVLEGRFVFPLPASASISDLVLWVGETPTSAEMVEKRRAASIFKGIVDDTVRPRDPALLEWAQGREVSLKIFPIDAKSSRRVRFTFEEPVADLGGRGRFVVPLSAGADRATRIKDFSLRVRVEGSGVSDIETPRYAARVDTGSAATEVAFSAQGFAPANDFVLTYRSEAATSALMIREPDRACVGDRRVCPPVLEGATIIRTLLGKRSDEELPAAIQADRVIVVDKSASQTAETLATQVALVRRVLETLESDERFAILACDSACEAYPSDGLAAASPALVRGAGEWLGSFQASGASDLSGALSQGLGRLDGSEGGQLVVLGDGVPSAGELGVEAIVARASRRSTGADLRFVGAGRNVDELALRALARGLDGTFDALDPSADRETAVAALAFSLSQPVLRDIEIDLPDGVSLAIDAPTAMRFGDELRLATIADDGFDDGGELVIRGRLGNEELEQRSELTLREGPHGFASRSVARAQIDGLEMLGAAGADDLVIDLSKRFFVMSRQTSLLVLENDAMFKAFGIERTRGGRDVAAPSVRMGGMEAGPTAPWGTFDRSPSATGNMWGDSMDDSFGAGGLGLSGIGSGGGGIGLGSIGTIGRGAGTGSGFGDGVGRLGGTHKSSAPSVRMGGTSVSGRLPPEVIQRIVRQNFGRFRLCYENALRKNPELSGRVTVSFVIGRDGSVGAVSGSGIADNAMVSCVTRAFFGLSFPVPEAGVVKVTYPIVFSPDGAHVPGGSRSSVVSGPVPPQIQNGDDSWVNRSPEAVAKLEADVARDGSKRTARGALVRGLLARGRFAEAVTRANEYVAIDPDRAEPLELLAEALLASGEVDRALAVLDSTAEMNRDKARSHRRIARAFEARGDERRACAHWVSLASLEKTETSKREAWRCRARALGETQEVAEEIERHVTASSSVASSPVVALLRSIKTASVGGYEWPAAGSDEVRVDLSCAGERASCPVLFTVDDRGRVVSDHLPDADGRRFATTWGGGNYRALLAGGDVNQGVMVALSTQGHTRKVELRRAQRSTALTARIEQISFGWGGGLGRLR